MNTVNFKVVTEQGKFDAGTVGGQWAWYLRKDKEDDYKWLTPEHYTSQVLEEGSYTISVQRLDVGEVVLGPMVSIEFTVDGVNTPEIVYIDIAQAVTANVVPQ